MTKFKEGERLNIHSYKHDGKIHRSWDDAFFIAETEEYAIFGNYKTVVTESDGRKWRTKEPAIMYFSKNNWFNIIGQIKHKVKGRFPQEVKRYLRQLETHRL